MARFVALMVAYALFQPVLQKNLKMITKYRFIVHDKSLENPEEFLKKSKSPAKNTWTFESLKVRPSIWGAFGFQFQRDKLTIFNASTHTSISTQY